MYTYIPIGLLVFALLFFRDFARLAVSNHESTLFLMGDFNQLAEGDHRINIGTGKLSPERPGLLKTFASFHLCTEIHQSEYTRAGFRKGKLTSLSRLDRIYTNLDSGSLTRGFVQCRSADNICDTSRLSDHSLVLCSICTVARERNSTAKLNRFVAESDTFVQEFSQ